MQKYLPYVILIIGLGMACDYGSPLCFLSGTMLMLIGCIILLRRSEHRQDQPSGIIMKHTLPRQYGLLTISTFARSPRVRDQYRQVGQWCLQDKSELGNAKGPESARSRTYRDQGGLCRVCTVGSCPSREFGFFNVRILEIHVTKNGQTNSA